MPCRALVVNRVLPPVFPHGTKGAAQRMQPPELVAVLAAAGQEAGEAEAAALLEAARIQDERVRAQRGFTAALSPAGPVSELPFLFTRSFGPAEVEALSRELVP